MTAVIGPWGGAPWPDEVDACDDDPEERAREIRDQLPILDWEALWADEQPEEWVIEPLLPARRLVAMYSAPKVGKSLLMLEVAVAVSRGEEVLGTIPDRPRRVLYVDFENDPRGDVRSRLIAMGYGPQHLGNLAYLSFPAIGGLDTTAGGARLVAAAEAYEAEVVVIDTVSRAVEGEENSNDTWLGLYRHTGLHLKRAGVAMIRLDHSGKDTDRGMRGGSAKYGDVDAVWRLDRVTGDTLKLTCTDHRMQLSETELVLTRLTTPRLCHKVEGRGWMAAADAAQVAVIEAMDAAGLPDSTGRDKAREMAKAGNIKIGNEALARAVRIRQTRTESCPGQVGSPRTATPVRDSLPTTSRGDDETAGHKPADLSRTGRGQVRRGASDDLSVLPPPYREDRSEPLPGAAS